MMRELASANSQLVFNIFLELKKHVVSPGGFRERQGGLYRADATAWAILTLTAAGDGLDIFNAARSRLAADQLRNGSICISPSYPQAVWPTSLAILAWQGSPVHHSQQARAVQFLLETTGRHWKKSAGDPMAHNPALKGWPWIADTHSWVEPTAISMIALHGAGYERHPRIEEATRMLMDRQLPHGGWNCGNTIVFGQELRPAPESTGAALHALAGLIPREEVQSSLDYLGNEVTHLRTPIALGWSLLGLNSWGVAVPNVQSLITDCLKRQERYGPYDTTSLCLLVLPLVSPNGLLAKSTGTFN
jgi:hypothetical protein